MTKFEGSVSSAASARSEFEKCWRDPNATQFELPVADVNKLLSERYIMRPHIKLTRAMIWDMECKKALDPVTYVPYVVAQAGIWSRSQLSDGCDHFVRWSIQKAWINEQQGRVIESLVHVEHSAGGSEDNPQRIWGIVILTGNKHDRYIQPFKGMVAAGLLPGYLEIYLRRDLNVELTLR